MAGAKLSDPDAGVLRSAVALLPSFLLILRAGGISVLRTNRLGGQFARAMIWGGSNVASFFAYHLLPLADAIALTFAAPLFLTALSWPILRESVGCERWLAVTVGFTGVLIMAHPSGAGNWVGMLNAILCALCNAVGTLTVRGLTRTEAPASIVWRCRSCRSVGSRRAPSTSRSSARSG